MKTLIIAVLLAGLFGALVLVDRDPLLGMTAYLSLAGLLSLLHAVDTRRAS